MTIEAGTFADFESSWVDASARDVELRGGLGCNGLGVIFHKYLDRRV